MKCKPLYLIYLYLSEGMTKMETKEKIEWLKDQLSVDSDFEVVESGNYYGARKCGKNQILIGHHGLGDSHRFEFHCDEAGSKLDIESDANLIEIDLSGERLRFIADYITDAEIILPFKALDYGTLTIYSHISIAYNLYSYGCSVTSLTTQSMHF